MGNALDKLFSGETAAPSRDLKVVTAFKADVKRDSKGNAGFSIRPVLADGTEGRFGDMWIRLAEGPATLRAFAASLPAIYESIKKLDAYMVKEGDWPAAAKAETATAAKAPAAKPATKSVAAAAPAKSADIFDDLPF